MAPISGNLYPTTSNTGTTFTETGVADTVGGYIISSTNATTVSTTMVAGGKQGSMFALRFASISLNKTLVGTRVKPADQFTYKIHATSSGNTLGTATSSGAGNEPSARPCVVPLLAAVADSQRGDDGRQHEHR